MSSTYAYNDLDPPLPTDKPSEVQTFVRSYFVRKFPKMGGKEMATIMESAEVPGHVLYSLNLESMKGLFGNKGAVLYQFLNESKYGYVRYLSYKH